MMDLKILAQELGLIIRSLESGLNAEALEKARRLHLAVSGDFGLPLPTCSLKGGFALPTYFVGKIVEPHTDDLQALLEVLTCCESLKGPDNQEGREAKEFLSALKAKALKACTAAQKQEPPASGVQPDTTV